LLKIQVVNDDGPETSLLAPFLDGLLKSKQVSELRITIPDRNRSWIGSAMTRHEPVAIREDKIGEHSLVLVSGTPADAASIAINNLFPERPHLVLSGPNLGVNSGLPYAISSGTLGAATIASMSGVPAIALSCEIPGDVWQLLEEKKADEADENFKADWQRLGHLAGKLGLKIYSLGVCEPGLVISVNIPWSATESTPIRVTQIKRGFYGELFTQNSDGTFSLRPKELVFRDEDSFRDRDCIREGLISVSVIDPGTLSDTLNEEQRKALEQKF